MNPRLVFMGSPEFALPVLQELVEQYHVVGVVTQPDRPAGRGRVLTPPPVKLLADELRLPVIQPHRLSEPAAFQQLQTWAPDLVIVAAFGQILKPAVLDLPHLGCVNVHASLLPRWRGAAPIQAAILNGDDQTGITIMCMDPGVDTGSVLSQRAIPIGAEDTAASLSSKLSALGAGLLVETLPHYLAGELQATPQDDAHATYAPMIKKEAGQLDFSRSSTQLDRQVRAYHPWPGAFTYWNGQPLKILRAHVAGSHQQLAGTHTVYQDSPAIAASDGLLVIDELQLAGRNPQPGPAFLRGARNWAVG